MEFREIAFGSAEYEQECNLRNGILRRPLGLNVYDENLERERGQLHFGLFDSDGAIIGCAVAVPLSETLAKIRQMAVAEASRGQGLGRRIMESVEERLRLRGFRELTLHARVVAAGFYTKLGFSVVGEEFVEVTVPHVAMRKNIWTPRAGCAPLDVGGQPVGPGGTA